MTARDKALDILLAAAAVPDDRIDLAEMALALAVLDAPDAEFEPYRQHLARLAAEVHDAVRTADGAPDAPGADGLEARIAILRSVLADGHGYRGDSETYEALENANLIRVVERKRGLPVALGILYIHAARSQGWDMVGLNFPGHFLVRMDHAGERAILDPFDRLAVRSPQDLRELLKQTAGGSTELTPDHYALVTNRDVLLRLQNNLKLRHLRDDRAEAAAEVVENMLLFAPEQPALWREAGLLNAHCGKLGAAIRAFETFMDLGTRLGASQQLLHQTATLVQQLRSRLN